MTKNNIVTRNTFIDGDAVFEQITSYDPVTEEATIIVPAHNSEAFSSNSNSSLRQGIRIIMTSTKMYTITDVSCLCESLPSHVNLDNFKVATTSTHNNKDAAASGAKFAPK